MFGGCKQNLLDSTGMHGPAHRRALQFILVALSLVISGCDGFVYVRGVVRNPHGEPVAGAKIHVTNMVQYWYTESDANGCFNASGTTAPTHSSEPLRVVAPGYKNASAKVRTAATRNHVIVTLAPSDSQGASRIQLLTPQNEKDLQPCNPSR